MDKQASRRLFLLDGMALVYRAHFALIRSPRYTTGGLCTSAVFGVEYKTGQTIGKKILNLRVVNIYGKKPDLKGIMISSFGKSFLLPIDVVLGWLLTNEKRQRVFNKLGDTLIVKIKESEDISDMKYTKD